MERTSQTNSALIAIVGYVLSPLSWWNDLFVNVPLAYVFALPFSLLDQRCYLPAFVIGYWLTNLLGLVLLHSAGASLLKQQRRGGLKNSLLITLLYTGLIVLLVWLDMLPHPEELALYVN